MEEKLLKNWLALSWIYSTACGGTEGQTDQGRQALCRDENIQSRKKNKKGKITLQKTKPHYFNSTKDAEIKGEKPTSTAGTVSLLSSGEKRLRIRPSVHGQNKWL
jgi:hypothetical protein